MEWDKASAKFYNESHNLRRVSVGNITPSEVYVQRCQMFKENPPVALGEQWDGVYRLTKK